MGTIGKRLRKLRKSKKWTLQHVADKLGLRGHSTYSNWEYDRTEPDGEMLLKLSEIFEVPVSYLLGEEKKSNSIDPVLMKIKELAEEKNLDLQDPDTIEMIKKVIEVVAINKNSR